MTSPCLPPYYLPPLCHLWHSSDPTVSQFREKTQHFIFSMPYCVLELDQCQGWGKGKERSCAAVSIAVQLSYLVQVDHYSCYLRTCKSVFSLFAEFECISSSAGIPPEAGGSSCCSNYSHPTESSLKIELKCRHFPNYPLLSALESQQNTDREKVVCAGISILSWLRKPR